MSEAAPARASDLPTRFAAGVAMIGVALLATWLGGWWFRVLVVAAAAIMLLEWADMHKVARHWAWVGVALMVALLLGGIEYLYPADGADWLLDKSTGEMVAFFDNRTLVPNWIAFAVLALASLVLGLAPSRTISALAGGTGAECVYSGEDG